jgi:hypothetical protein
MARSPRKPRRALRWAARIALGLLAFAIFALAVVIGIVHTSWGKNYLREKIVAELQADFPGSTIAELDGSPLGTLILRGVTINGRDRKPMVTVDRIAVSAALRPLLGKTVHVESVRVSGVSVSIREQPPAPAPAKPATPATASEPSSWSIEVPDIEVDGVRIDLATATGHEVFEDIALRAGAWIPAGKPIAATARLHGTWRGKPLTAFASVEQDGDLTRVPIVAATLGGASLAGYGLEIASCDPCTRPLVTGVLAGRAPAALVKELAGQVLPSDVAFSVEARPTGDVVALATTGSARIDAFAVPDWKALTARALVSVEATDLASFTDGTVTGAGTVVAAVDAGAERVQGVVSVVADVADAPPTRVVLAIAGTRTRVEMIAGARARGTRNGIAATGGRDANANTRVDATSTNPTAIANLTAASTQVLDLRDIVGDATLGAIAHLDITPAGDAITLPDAHVVASVNGITDARGAFFASVTASGPVWPVRDVSVLGTVDADGVRREDLHVRSARADLVAHVGQHETTASGTVTVSGVRKGTSTVGGVRVTVKAHADEQHTTADADVAVTDARSGTTRVPTATMNAAITSDVAGTIAVALGTHRVRMGDGSVFSGSGGRVTITDETISVDAVRTGSGTSTVTASARIDRKTKNLVGAQVKARDIELAIVDPQLRGAVDADVDVSRRGGRWQGGGTVTARGAAIPGKPIVDATAELRVEGRKVTLDANVGNREVGRGTVAIVVKGPHDITDLVAWRRLPRAAIERVAIGVPRLDVGPLGGTGTVDGELVITGTEAHGALHARGVATKAGLLEGTLELSAADVQSIRTVVTARVDGIAPVTADATLVVPARPFDPAAWRTLGTRVIREANIQLKALEVSPALFARLGYDLPYRARIDASIVADAGARSATLTTDVHGLSGGKLTAPIEIHLGATTAPTGTTVDATARSGKVGVTLAATSAMTIEHAIEKGTDGVAIGATVTIPTIAARDLLGLIGRTGVVAGSVGGTVTLAGTTTKPTVRAQLSAQNLTVASTLSGKKPPVLDSLDIDARWLGDHAELDVTGRETGGRLLVINAHGTKDVRAFGASIQAANFDLAPLAAFAPGQLKGGRGTLNAALTIRGLDPQTGDVRGMLQIKDGRLPLSPELGTLRRATLDVKIIKQTITADFDGRLGAGGGSIKGTLGAELVGGMPMRAALDAQVRKVQPIGALQPQLDADVTGTFVNEGPRWTGKVVVARAKVVVPQESGNELLGEGAPSDMIFVDSSTVPRKPRHQAEKPWLVTRIEIQPTDVIVDDSDVRVRLVARGKLDVQVGQGITVNGAIRTVSGTIDVLGRRYRLDQGLVDFDGSLDPRLDIRMVHDFKNLTLTVDVRGRASDPDPRMSGDPGTYTDGQLLSFFAGAEPGNDDSATQANEAVVGGGLTILSSRVGQRINKYSPVKFDAINYEAATAASSRAVRFGMRLSEKSYLVWRQRLEARPDENPGEIVFEYQIRSNMLFETTVGERAAGGDFLLRTRW